MEFGLGKDKQITDNYPENAILTLPSYIEGEGTTKASLNNKAYEILGLKEGDTNEISFSTSKSMPNQTFVINANEYDSKANIKVNKNGTYSNKNSFSVLKKRYNTNMEDDLHLEIVPTERVFDGQTIFELVKFKQEPAIVGDESISEEE